MKNKKPNRLLLPAVLLIWLAVLFRWEGTGVVQVDSKREVTGFLILQDSILPIPTLTLAYRDPFLDRSFYSKAKNMDEAFLPQSIPQASTPNQKITFKGAVETNGKLVALVEVENKLLYVEKDEKIAHWICKKVELDQLMLIQNRHQIYLLTGKDTLL